MLELRTPLGSEGLDPDDPREIKTTTSVLAVPLVGLALAAMTKFPKGFPRYKDKESSMSAMHGKKSI